MVEYIYFVKCPDCDDETFLFFDDAKDFATSCLSRKPVITQTEVQRNDFGECTDHCDLGTIWTWEEAVGDVTCDEPAIKIFTSGDFADYNPDNDSEFTALDNSCDHFDSLESVPDNFRKPAKSNHDELAEDYVNKFIIVGEKEDYSKQFYNVEAKEWVAKSEDATLFDNRNAAVEVLHDVDPVYFYTTHIMIKPIPVAAEESTGKPIPEGMTIEQLVEEMEENEDTVECTWCNELYDKSECRKEVDLGWLCDRCEAAIKSRGETLTFKENNYWDFPDESIDDETCIDGVLDNLVVDELEAIDGYDCADEAVQHASIPEDKKLKILDTLEHIKKEEEEHIDELRALSSTDILVDPSEDDAQMLFEDSDSEALLKSGKYLDYINGTSSEDLQEDVSKSDTVDLYYDKLTIEIQGPQRDVDDWDEVEYTDSFTITRSKRDVATALWEEGLITEEDVKDVPGGLTALEDDEAWEKFIETDSFDIIVEKHYNDLLTYYEDEAKEEFEDEFDWYDYQDNELGALIDYEYESRYDENLDTNSLKESISYCPECDTNGFDPQTNVCKNCKFKF